MSQHWRNGVAIAPIILSEIELIGQDSRVYSYGNETYVQHGWPQQRVPYVQMLQVTVDQQASWNAFHFTFSPVIPGSPGAPNTVAGKEAFSTKVKTQKHKLN